MERNWGISEGINPITYIVSDNISKTYSTVFNLLEKTSKQVKDIVLNDLLSGLKSIIAQSNSGNNTGEEDV